MNPDLLIIVLDVLDVLVGSNDLELTSCNESLDVSILLDGYHSVYGRGSGQVVPGG